MSVRTDTVNLIVNVNGNTAQANLNNLRKKANEIKNEMSGLVKGTAEYIAKGKELAQVNQQMDTLKKTIGLTALSQKELVAELNKLKALRGSVIPFSDEYKALGKSIGEVEKRLYDVRNGTEGFASWLSKISDEVKQFGVLAAAYLGFEFISNQFTNIINGAGKLSDQLADLRRVSGLTAEEADNLNKKLTGLDTRTSTEGLRQIAIIAGKLGVAKKDIFDFTKAVDQLVVSLGDELGDADQITTQLGKILNVFDGKVNGDNISRLGNAFVELANAGVASGGFIADFTQRVAGISKSAGISLGATVGLGAGLEELGQRSESSATAIQKLVSTIASDIPKAAKLAGAKSKEEIQKFANDFASKPQEVLIKFAEALVKNKNSFSEVAASFKDAGEEGARVVGVLQAIGQKGDFMREKINLGNESLTNTSAITEAFALKNETFGASLDKLGKEFNKLVSSSALNNFLKGAIENTISFINAIKKVPQFLAENRIALLTLVAGILILNKQYILSALAVIRDTVAKIANTVATKATAIASNIASVAQAAYIVVTNLLTGRITAATAAQRLYNIALSIGTAGLGSILAIVSALVIATSYLVGRTKELTAEQRVQEGLQKKISEATIDEVDKIKTLSDIIKSSAASYDTKKKALAELIALNPEYLKGLTLENFATSQGTIILDNYIKLLKEKASIEATAELRKEKLKEQTQAEFDLVKQQKKVDDLGVAGAIGQGVLDNFGVGTFASYDEAKKKVKDLKDDIVVLDKIVADNIKRNPNAVLSTVAAVSANVPIGASSGDKKAADKAAKDREREFDRLKKEAEKFQKELLELKRRGELKNEAPDQAEIDAVKDKYAKLLAEAKNYYDKHALSSKQFHDDELLFETLQSQELNAIYYKRFQKELDDQEKLQAEIGAAKEKARKDQLEKDAKANELAGRDKIAKAQRAVLNTTPGSDAEFQAKKALLKAQHDLEMEAKDLTNEELLLKDAEYNEAVKELNQDRINQQIDQVMQYVDAFTNALTSLNQFITNRENALFNKEKADNDRKKKGYKQQLDGKLISKEQYDKKVAAVDEEQDKKQRALQRKQAEREKALNLFNAIISNAQAIIRTMASVPFPFNIPLAIAQGIAGGLQVAAIANTPLPELGDGDWLRKGAKHKDKEGGIPIMAERDEAVMKAAAMNDANRYTVTGTTAQITSALNARAGGTSWAAGAVVQMASWANRRPETINPSLPRIMEQGGIVRPLNPAKDPLVGNDEVATLLRRNNQLLEEVISTTKEKSDKLQAVVSIKEYEQKKAQYEQAKKVSGLG